MKKIFVLCAVTALLLTVMIWRAVAKPARFGTFISAPKTDLSAILAAPDKYLGSTVAVEGTISEQCKSMGCFFFFRAGDRTLRVDLQEIAMHAPMHEGRTARVEGQIVPYNGAYQLYASAVEFK